MDISKWGNSAGANTANSPDGAPEGWSPSSVNDWGRETMAAVRRWYEDAQWINYGETPTYASASTFSVAGNLTSRYESGRRVKAYVGSSILYGTIDTATYSTATGVTLTLDSGNLTASLSSIAVGSLTVSNPSIPNTNIAMTASTASVALAIKYTDVSATAAVAAAAVTPAAHTVPVSTSAGVLIGWSRIICSVTYGNTVNFGQTNYTSMWGANNINNETYVQQIMPVGGTVKNLYAKAGVNTLNGAAVITLRKNGADTALTVSITAGATTVFSDSTNAVTFAAGDYLDWKIVAGGSSGLISAGNLSIAATIEGI